MAIKPSDLTVSVGPIADWLEAILDYQIEKTRCPIGECYNYCCSFDDLIRFPDVQALAAAELKRRYTEAGWDVSKMEVTAMSETHRNETTTTVKILYILKVPVKTTESEDGCRGCPYDDCSTCPPRED